MSWTRPRRRRRHDAVTALLVVLTVAAMHTVLGVFTTAGDSHPAVSVAGHDHAPALVPMPAPADPTAPVNPCHAAGRACCMSALPVPAHRPSIALLLVGIAVVIGLTQLVHLRRASVLRPDTGRHPPPDLAALCVLRT